MQTEQLRARYGAVDVPAAGPWNDTIDLLLRHRSVRAYRPDPVPAGTFETLVAAAQSAATSSNMQTWSVVAVEDAAQKALFARLAGDQKHIAECPLFLVFLADLSRAERLAIAEDTTLAALPYLETFLVAAIDAALAAQNAVIAAESLGLATLYIGALRNRPEEVAAALSLPKGAMGVFGLCIGYAAEGVPAAVKPRLAQSAVAFRERYGAADEGQARRHYDAALSAYAERHERGAYTWTERVKARLGATKSLNGRDRLREALNALGFPLK